MSERRILIPWEELMVSPRNLWFDDGPNYREFIDDCTRPITTDDIQEMIRRWEEWTDDERAEYKLRCETHSYAVYAGAAIDIASHPAPEHDPWEEMENVLNGVLCSEDGDWDAQALMDSWLRLKATRKKDE